MSRATKKAVQQAGKFIGFYLDYHQYQPLDESDIIEVDVDLSEINEEPSIAALRAMIDDM